MAVRGQRFHVELDSDNESSAGELMNGQGPADTDLGFIKDVTERNVIATASSPSPPQLKGTDTGFPAHKKRTRPSFFKQGRNRASPAHYPSAHEPSSARLRHSGQNDSNSGKTEKTTETGSAHSGASSRNERQSIDEENSRRLAAMSPQEIEQERRELMSGLSSTLIERLLKRANIDEGRTDCKDADHSSAEAPPSTKNSKPTKKVTFDTLKHPRDSATASTNPPSSVFDADAPPSIPPADLRPASSQHPLPLPPNMHFPQAPPAPALDPSDPDFLQNLHSKYFPDFPLDPSKLAWMAPIPTQASPADRDSPYSPSQESLPASSLRFDFQGRLIPPRLARQIPVTEGLHHHGLAPEAAGYAIPELARLARSAVAAQRCMAYQTLGRVLFRLGSGDFGDEDEELYLGLWDCLEKGRVVNILVAEAALEDGRGNRSCNITATEAVWLWHKGGGKRLKAQ